MSVSAVGGVDGVTRSATVGCCSDPSLCPCAREGVGCHVEGRHYCQCSHRTTSTGVSSCGNPHGLYEFDEWRVRQHAAQVLYGVGGGAGGGREEEWGVDAASPSLSPSASPSPHHSSASGSASASPSLSFLAFRSHSFSFHPQSHPHSSATAGGLPSTLLHQPLSPLPTAAQQQPQPPHRQSPALSRRASRVSPPSSPLLQQHIRHLQLQQQQQHQQQPV